MCFSVCDLVISLSLNAVGYTQESQEEEGGDGEGATGTEKGTTVLELSLSTTRVCLSIICSFAHALSLKRGRSSYVLQRSSEATHTTRIKCPAVGGRDEETYRGAARVPAGSRDGERRRQRATHRPDQLLPTRRQLRPLRGARHAHFLRGASELGSPADVQRRRVPARERR